MPASRPGYCRGATWTWTFASRHLPPKDMELGTWDSSEPPLHVPMGKSHLKFSERCLHRSREEKLTAKFGPDTLGFAGAIPKDCFVEHQISYAVIAIDHFTFNSVFCCEAEAIAES